MFAWYYKNKNKDKIQNKSHKQYKNLSEDAKQRLVEYKKRYYEMRKKESLSHEFIQNNSKISFLKKV